MPGPRHEAGLGRTDDDEGRHVGARGIGSLQRRDRDSLIRSADRAAEDGGRRRRKMTPQPLQGRSQLPRASPRDRIIERDHEPGLRRRIEPTLDHGRLVAVVCEGDPLFYGSYMHLHVRLAHRFRTEVVAGVSGMSGCWSAVGTPMAQGDDVFSVLPGTLAQDELERRLNETDAVVVIKLGRNLHKVRRALERTGRLARAVYVERGTMTDERAIPLAAKADDCAPYFAMVLVPGWERRP